MLAWKGLSKKKDIYRLFSFSIIWNSVEAFGYQAIFLLYQLWLFKSVPENLFGAQGAFFAAGYLGITLFDGAFDTGIIPVFSEFIKTKKSFLNIPKSLFIQSIILFCVPLGLCLSLSFFNLHPNTWATYCSWDYILLFSLFVVLEGTKKNLRSLLHLTFSNRFLAYVEILNIGSYATLVYLFHYLFEFLYLKTLVISFLFVSTITIGLLSFKLWNIWNNLPQKNYSIDKNVTRRFYISRLYSYGNQLTRIIFSNNFLLPFFSLSSGFASIAYVSLINTITFTCTSLLQKIFGPLGAAFFAHTKYFKQNKKSEIFSYIEGITWKLFFILISTFLFYSGWHSLKTESISTEILVSLFFLVHITESCFIIYEKFFIAEEKQRYFLLFNIINGIISFLIFSYAPLEAFIHKFSLCLMARLIAFAIFAQWIRMYQNFFVRHLERSPL